VAAIAFESGGWSRDSLDAAISIYRDPADLLAHWENSELADWPLSVANGR
jgi:hypothetical protein